MDSKDLGYFSHFPLLASCIARTKGPILELGCGWGSTPMIHYAAWNRFRVTADTNLEWLKTFAEGYASPRNHEFIHVKPTVHDPETNRYNIEAWDRFMDSWANVTKWGVAFVDQAPGEARVPSIMKLKGNANFIVAHDGEADEPGGGGNYRWRDLNGVFKYRTIMKRMRPWTIIYSDLEPFPLEPVDA